jgi:uncharacterized iron-regulated membrane protein
MGVRRAIFWLHLAAGCTAGAVVLVMSVTGVLLMYERQIVAWADGVHRSTRPPGAAPLGVDALLAGLHAARPDAAPTAVTFSAAADAPVTVALGRAGTVFLDPYDGRILGEGSSAARSFFQRVVAWHRWLGAEGQARAAGRAITGASNLLFLFLVTSGAVLWWPRERSWRAVRAVAAYRGGLRGRARDFNWHNVTGLWLCVPLFVIVVSAVVISYPWAGDLLYRALGETPPPRVRAGAPAGAPRDGRPFRTEMTPPPSRERLDRLVARARAQVPAWQTIALRLPEGGGPVSFTIDSGRGAIRPDRRAQLLLDRRTGEVVRFEPYESQSPARRLRGWLRWLHTGEAGGVWGQTLAGIASAGAALLVWTGLALAWRRLLAWRQRTATPRSAAATPTATPAAEPGIEPSLQGEAT